MEDEESISDQILRMKHGIEVSGKVVRSGTKEPLAEVEVVFRFSPRTPSYDVYLDGKRTGTTSPDGEFSVKGLAVGSHQVRLAARGYLRKAISNVLVASSGEAFDFSLEPGYAASGQVLDAAGQPAAGAKVQVDVRRLADWERSQLFETESFTDDDGKYRLEGLIPLDYHTLIAGHENHALSWVSDVKVGPKEESSGVDFRLKRGRSIRGRVLDEQGQPVPAAQVRCMVETCGIDTITPEARVLSGIEFNTTRSDEQGEYEFLHLGGKCYDLSAAVDGLLPGGAVVWDWGSQGTSVEDVDFYLRTPKSLHGRVVDGGGNPLGGVWVQAESVQVETDENGTFTIQGLSGGRVSVTASREGYQGADLEVRVPGEDVSLVLHRLAVIAGRVQVSNQAALPHVKVRVLGEQGFGWTANVLEDSEGNEGKSEVPVPGGRYVVQAEALDFAPTRTEPIRLQAGERREGIVLNLLPEAVVKGHVVARSTGEPISEATVSFRPVTNLYYSRTAMTGEDGAFELDSLPSGEFELELMPGLERPHPDALFGPFMVQSGQTKELALELGKGGGIRGVFREGGEPPGTRFRELNVCISRQGEKLYTLRVGRDGTFGCSGLSPGDYGVSVWGTRSDGNSFYIERRAVRVNDSKVSEVSFEEPSRIRVEGRVTSGGQPVAGVTIAAMDPWRDIEWGYGWWDLTLASAKTDKDGRYRLALKGGRRYFLLLREEDERGQTQVELGLPRISETFRFDISLPGGRLQGVVVEMGTAIPVRDASVELFDSGQERRSYLSLVRARRGRCKTDHKGRFVVGHLPSGAYSVRIGDGFSVEAWTHDISVSEGEAAAARIELGSGIGVAVGCMDQHGYLVTELGEILRDSSGNLIATPQFHRVNVPPGSYEVTVVHPRYAQARIPIEVDGQSRVPTLTLSPGGTLKTVVRDSAGSATSQAEVVVLDGEGRNVFDDRIPALDPFVANPCASPFTGDDGMLVLKHLGLGKYRVSARKGTARSNEVEVTISDNEVATARLILTDD